MFSDSYRNKTVWLSGHTGFKGAWMARWLHRLGARVHGFSIDIPTQPALFEQLGLERLVDHEVADICDSRAVRESIVRCQPDFVFHFAAQTVVRTSYVQPVATYAANVMGTINVLEAIRSLPGPCAAVFVTTDKCYENREVSHAYSEEDPLGGHDPYSSSKAAAELAVSSWRRSFLASGNVSVATARAGNVIGGGDWTKDQLLPDCIRALQSNRTIEVRNPVATRPWQHVLEPLSGYLWLGAVLARPDLASTSKPMVTSAFNFGPNDEANRTVREIVTDIINSWPGTWRDVSDPASLHEAALLMISSEKAKRILAWTPTWPFSVALQKTISHYRNHFSGQASAEALCLSDIDAYERAAVSLGQRWSI